MTSAPLSRRRNKSPADSDRNDPAEPDRPSRRPPPRTSQLACLDRIGFQSRGRAPARNPAFQRRLCNNLRMHADRWVDQSLADQVDDQLVELAVEIFTMLADATRVRIVLALKDGELSVNTLADVVGKSPAAVSQHLAKLRLARIVTTRHEGNRVFYRLANEHPLELVADAMFQAEHSLDDQPRHHNRTRQEGDR